MSTLRETRLILETAFKLLKVGPDDLPMDTDGVAIDTHALAWAVLLAIGYDDDDEPAETQ